MKIKVYLILILIQITSCSKKFTYNFDNSPQVNVSCFISANDTVRVQLTYLLGDTVTNNILADDDYISNAHVFLYDDENNFFQLSYQDTLYEKGWYFLNSPLPEAGKSYKLKVIVPGYDTVYAETTIPLITKINSIEINNIIYSDTIAIDFFEEETEIKIDINFNDNKNELNYYTYESNKIYKSYDPVIEPRFRADYYYYDGTNPVLQNAFFSDNIFNGKNYRLSTETTISYQIIEYFGNTSSKHRLNSLSYDAYAFYKSSYLFFKRYENPLSEPVIIYSNIINGTGIFAGLSYDEKNIVIKSK